MATKMQYPIHRKAKSPREAHERKLRMRRDGLRIRLDVAYGIIQAASLELRAAINAAVPELHEARRQRDELLAQVDEVNQSLLKITNATPKPV